MIIKWISMWSGFDSSSYDITDQESLRQIFNTPEDITYDLLTEHLQQSPALTHDPDGIYNIATPYEVGSEYGPIPDGTYFAQYDLQGIPAEITFIEENGAYYALSVYLNTDNW